MKDAEPRPSESSPWAPLSQTVFRSLWAANLVSNVGTWMHEVAESWLMTALTPSPLLVALIQSADSTAALLLALPGGALADVLERRKLLIFTQTWMLVAAAGLGAATLMHVVTPWMLLAFTFLLGIGSAMNGPAWQATIPDLVPQEQLTAAVTLNSLSFNMGRVLGPAFGGLLIAAIGTGNVFLLNAASFLGVIVVLTSWRGVPAASRGPAERLFGAMQSGMRFVRHSPQLQAIFVRVAVFIMAASALWSLAPVLARRELGAGSLGYGLMLGCLGAGAVLAALMLPRFRRELTLDQLVSGAVCVFALGTLGLACARSLALACLAMLLSGTGWMAVMSTLQAVIQVSVPGWVRARALSIYMIIFHIGRAGGSALWGSVAEHLGVRGALLWSSGALVLGLSAAWRWGLREGQRRDSAPHPFPSEPNVSAELHPDQGPVLVTVEYLVEPEKEKDFGEAMRELSQHRRRDGAYDWGLFRDAADDRRFVETFLVDSWAEHLRQHRRGTVAGRAAIEKAQSFHSGTGAPKVTHLVAAQS